MTSFRFEWDEVKNAANQRKHGVSFEQATQVFTHPLEISLHDISSDDEERWQTFGYVNGVLLLMVVHTSRSERADVEVIRIISARRATPRERRQYEAQVG